MYEGTRKKERWQSGGISMMVLLLVGLFLLGSVAHAASSPESAESLPSDVRVRWNDDAWEYSSDGGETWTSEAPEGVTVHDDQSLTLIPGNEASVDDTDLWGQGLDNWLASVYKEVDNIVSDTMPEGYEEWGSFIRFDETIARKGDEGQWEYSSDGGETWTDETPEGFSVNENGTMLSFSGNDANGDIRLEGF